MRVVAADDENDKLTVRPRTAVQMQQTAPSSPEPPTSDDFNSGDPEFERRYEKRLDRIMRMKEMELLGITPTKGPKPSEPRVIQPTDARTELVKVAHNLKSEYQAMQEASQVLSEFAKPNPVELFLNSEMAKGIGQVLGTAMIGIANNAVAQAAMKKQQQMLSQQQAQQPRPAPSPAPQPQPYSPPMPGYTPAPRPPIVQNQPDPQMSGNVEPREVNVRLDENDKKLMENQQSNMLRVAQGLGAVVDKLDSLNKRMDEFEAKVSKVSPPPVIPAVPKPVDTGVPSITESPKVKLDENIWGKDEKKSVEKDGEKNE